MVIFTKEEEEKIYSLAEKIVGVSQQGSYRKDILVSNIERRLEETGRKSLYDYLVYVKKNEEEYCNFVSALTIHTTNWFRELPHFDKMEGFLRDKLSKDKSSITVNVLSAACSTGEEVYSLAMLLELIRKSFFHFDYRVYGFDIDPVSVNNGDKGIYPIGVIDTIPPKYHDYIRRGKDRAKDYFSVCKEIKNKCSFFEIYQITIVHYNIYKITVASTG